MLYEEKEVDKEQMAKVLRELRGNRSREKVASAIGISAASLQLYENAKRVPRDEVKAALSRYYHKEQGYIFTQNIHKS